MPNSVATLLMFEGSAEEAMNCYLALFKRSALIQIDRYGPGEMGKEGSVKVASFKLCGHDLKCIDSPAQHAFTFTPSVSLFVECESEAELDDTFSQLSAGGSVLMPLDNYGFSKKFGWLYDRFGVSRQLNLQ